jgi:F-type H+-transporting ATPase subunit delta
VRVRSAPRGAVVREQPRALARRYARAVLDVAAAQGPTTAAALGAELSDVVGLLEQNHELRSVLQNPGLGGDVRRRVLTGILTQAGASPLLARLMDLLAGNDRVGLLPALAEEYAEALNQREGRVSAEAVTAVPLEEAQRSALAKALNAAIGKTVELKARVDPAVLGGVRVTMGGRTYDGTVRTRLAALRERLVSGR